MRPVIGLVAALAALPATTASAQIAVQQWRPATEAGSFVALEPPTAPVGYGLGAALWLQYANEPVVLPMAGGGEATVVTDQLTLDFTATIGLFDWLALSMLLPSSLYQGPYLPHFSLDRAAVSDPHLLAKFVLFRPHPRNGGFGVALIPDIGLPLGDPRRLLGDRNFTFTPRASFGYLAGPALLVANLGYRFREGAPLGTLLVDDEVLLAIGAELPVPHTPLAATVELTGATAAQRPFADLRETSLEALASMRARLGPIAFQPGVAVGLTPGYLVPDFRLFAAVAFAPRYRDADGDQIDDLDDACFEEREDLDGFEDSDGCPDLDNDADGTPDLEDRCPDRAGSPDHAGCP